MQACCCFTSPPKMLFWERKAAGSHSPAPSLLQVPNTRMNVVLLRKEARSSQKLQFFFQEKPFLPLQSYVLRHQVCVAVTKHLCVHPWLCHPLHLVPLAKPQSAAHVCCSHLKAQEPSNAQLAAPSWERGPCPLWGQLQPIHGNRSRGPAKWLRRACLTGGKRIEEGRMP